MCCFNKVNLSAILLVHKRIIITTIPTSTFQSNAFLTKSGCNVLSSDKSMEVKEKSLSRGTELQQAGCV